MTLFLVPYQLSFLGMNEPGPPVTPLLGDLDAERDKRDATAWLRQAIAYCRFMAADSLRPHRDRTERKYRSSYRDAIRLISYIMYTKVGVENTPQLVLPSINAEPAYTTQELELMQKPVAWLVDELMKADSRLSARGSLMHLRRGKLARMLVRAWSENLAQQTERRSA